MADEVLLTGSAPEITPIRSIDKIIIGEGKRGPLTKSLQDEYFACMNGEREDKYHWLTYL
jgi:branched-chain amino acid aminotransferase